MTNRMVVFPAASSPTMRMPDNGEDKRRSSSAREQKKRGSFEAQPMMR